MKSKSKLAKIPTKKILPYPTPDLPPSTNTSSPTNVIKKRNPERTRTQKIKVKKATTNMTEKEGEIPFEFSDLDPSDFGNI